MMMIVASLPRTIFFTQRSTVQLFARHYSNRCERLLISDGPKRSFENPLECFPAEGPTLYLIVSVFFSRKTCAHYRANVDRRFDDSSIS